MVINLFFFLKQGQHNEPEPSTNTLTCNRSEKSSSRCGVFSRRHTCSGGRDEDKEKESETNERASMKASGDENRGHGLVFKRKYEEHGL